MIKNILLISLTFFKIFVPAQNFSVTYGFPELTTISGTIDPSISPTLTGLNFSSFHAFGTASNPNASARFSFTGWPAGALSNDDNYGNYTAVLSPTVYYEVKLSVDPGYTLNLTELNFDVRRSGTGIRTYCVRSDLDNFTNNLSAATGTNANLTVIPNDVFFWKYDSVSTSNDQRGSKINFDASFSALTGSLMIRFYAWNAESSGGSFSLDNVNFVGTLMNSSNTTGLENLSGGFEKIKVFPNPCSSGRIILESSDEISDIDLKSILGEKMQISILELNSTKMELDLSAVDAGIYYLNFFINKNKFHQKIIVRD